MLEKTYALIRVSTEEQNEIRQLIAMSKLGIPKKNIVVEKESGKSTIRTKYYNLVKHLNAGDILYIENIDRLSRDYDGILNEWHVLTRQKNITVKILDTPMLDTDQTQNDLLTKFIRDILLHIHAFQAEYEWQKIKGRQAQGIAVAKSNGKPLGRPKSVHSVEDIEKIEQIIKEWKNKNIDTQTAMKLLNKKRSAFYNLVQKISGGKDEE